MHTTAQLHCEARQQVAWRVGQSGLDVAQAAALLRLATADAADVARREGSDADATADALAAAALSRLPAEVPAADRGAIEAAVRGAVAEVYAAPQPAA
jgi:hypothetical protein